MAGEWRDVALEDVADELTVGYVGPMASEYVDEGVPFLRSLNVEPLRINKNDLKFITPEFHRRIQKSRLAPGDVVIVRTGKPGACSVVPEWLTDANCSDLVIVRCGKQLNNRFLAYYVNTVASGHVAAHLVGAVQQHFNVGSARTLRLNLPPLTEQKAIAAVLGALDDKIELNRRMNATLEAMARALFQSWFVDFDPVRAKLDGRPPAALDPATAALFPEHLEDSPLGHIPKGWEVKTVGDIGDVICGKTPPTSVSDYYGDDIPFITIPDMHGNVFGAATARKLSHAGANSQANKTLPPGSLCVSCIATPGLVVITAEDSQTNQQINSVVPHQKEETYFWYWVMTGLGAEIASSGSGGSVLVNLSKGRFETLQVIKPPHALIRAYHNAVRPLFEAILANTDQSRTLATLRDTLLPKLLSGELSVTQTTEEISAR
jgi:type I restriction enzyme S subunit